MDDNRIPLEAFADFSRCTLYRDPADPTAGTGGSIRYEAAMEAFELRRREIAACHAKGEVHPDDPDCAAEYNALKGREPGKFGLPTCLNTSSRGPTGGWIGESQLPWKYLREKDPIIWRNGVGLPLSMIPRELAPADVIAQIDALEA